MAENLKFAFYGALVFQILFILILYLQDNKKSYYLYYSLYVFAILLALEPKILQVKNAYVFLIEWPGILVYFLFLDTFLDLSGHSKYYKKFMQYLAPGVLFLLVLQFVMTYIKENYGPMEKLDQVIKWFDEYFFYFAYIGCIYSIIETFKLKNALSRYILVGIFFVSTGVILNRVLFKLVDVIPIAIGIFLELLFFSAAIGYKTKLVESEKRKAQEQLTQNTLMALRDQMSPHFISNCLNSIKLLIQQQNEQKAIEYLTEFSKLHRLIVEHFQDLKISLQKELDICRSYLEMESLRFKQSFDYKFDVRIDQNLMTFVEVPPLLFQPILENAIWHGLLKKEGEKRLMIQVENSEDCIKCTIEDNGVGRKSSAFEKITNPSEAHKKSTGLSNTLEKIKVFGELYHTNIEMDFIDKFDNQGKPAGLKVVFSIFHE